MKNWKQYGDNTIEIEIEIDIALKASYNQVAAMFNKFVHSDFYVKRVLQIERFEQDVNTYKIKLRGADSGAVADYLKGLKNSVVGFECFQSEVEKIKTFASAKLL